MRRSLRVRASAITSIFVVCSLLSVVPAQGTSSPDVAPSPAPKQPTLLPALTTPTTEVHRNPGGTFTAEIAAGPVRMPSDSSPTGWAPVDTTLSEGKSGLQPNATLADVTFSPGGEGPWRSWIWDRGPSPSGSPARFLSPSSRATPRPTPTPSRAPTSSFKRARPGWSTA
jgi:hypothetical protein